MFDFLVPPAWIEQATCRLQVGPSHGRACLSMSECEGKQQRTRAPLVLTHARFRRHIRRPLDDFGRCGVGVRRPAVLELRHDEQSGR